MTRFAAALLSVVMALDMLTALVAFAALQAYPGQVAAEGAVPRVVIIVGPTGPLTEAWRREAMRAAAIARRYTSDVTEIYSPHATWPVVRRALQGASLVVYLGHGNGWPSPYRDSLYPPTQDGLGLNPVAGVDDATHQYFGERYLARRVKLAPGAVVLLHHLCYASGDAEPGMPGPTLAVAQQRVDNYAAGWIQVGARAVVAEGHLGPEYYVRELLKGVRDVSDVWRRSPSANHHVIAFDSDRSPRFSAFLDPDRPQGGFFRALVVDSSRAGAALTPSPRRDTSASPPDPRSLAKAGVSFGVPAITGPVVTGGNATLAVPIKKTAGARLPIGLMIGTRWTLIVPLGSTPDAAARPAGQPATGAPPSAEPSPTPGSSVGPSIDPSPEAVAAIDNDPGLAPSRAPHDRSASASPEPADPTQSAPVDDRSPSAEASTITLDIQPEDPDSLVTIAKPRPGERGQTIDVTMPERPGLYSLMTTIHDGDGVAYDADTQAAIPALLVTVSGRMWARYALPLTLAAPPGARLAFPIVVRNSGTLPWAVRPIEDLVLTEPLAAARPRLTFRWVTLGPDRSAAAQPPIGSGAADLDTPFMEPGDVAHFDASIVAPETSGSYLLLVDVVSPNAGSLAARGVPPGLIIVEVAAADGLTAPGETTLPPR